jgi:aspartate carbamoyltransferase regulatory subunit
LVKSRVRFNRVSEKVPEKVPEKVQGGFRCRAWSGSTGFRRRFQRRFRRRSRSLWR